MSRQKTRAKILTRLLRRILRPKRCWPSACLKANTATTAAMSFQPIGSPKPKQATKQTRLEFLRNQKPPAFECVETKRLDCPARPARLVPVVLPLLSGASPAGGRSMADQTLESLRPPCRTDPGQLHARRPWLPAAATTGPSSMGI